MSIATLRTRIDRLIARIEYSSPHSWAFVLLPGQEIPPATMQRIGPQDTLYIKRIVLTHEREQAA